jgi:site-specific DNA-methyltransferase (adenine-specific)
MASCIRFAMDLISSQSKWFRYDLIYHKNLPTGFLNAKKRPLRTHEFILVFTRGDHLYIPQMTYCEKPIPFTYADRKQSENYGAYKQTNDRAGAHNRYPHSVLTFRGIANGDKFRAHPQQKPTEMLRWLVRTYSKEGDLVVDPFAGSGSTGHAAYVEGREFRGWDTNPRFAH